MFCLFRNSRFIYPLNYIVLAISLGPVFYWLYFTFVEKSFLDNFMSGQALIVDLLFGLPIVLLFAIIIYAMMYWTLKVIAILFAPYLLVENKFPEQQDSFDPASTEEYGEDYWKKDTEENTEKKIESDKNSENK